MPRGEADRSLLEQTRGKADKLLGQLRRDREEILSSPRLEKATACEGAVAVESVIAALEKISSEAERALKRKT